MTNLPQLFMRKSDLLDLPALSARVGRLPDGISLHTHIEGEEASWEALLERCFGNKIPFEGQMRAMKNYSPSGLFYLRRNGIDVAVAGGVEAAAFPGEGWLHYVGVDPEARGLGLAKHVSLAVMYYFYSVGYKTIVLSTDDHRLAAIKTYLGLGFEPIMSHESHGERWAAVYEKLGIEKK